MKESEIQAQILHYLRTQQYFVWRSHTGPMLQKGGRRVSNPLKGYPDISGILKTRPGVLFCIEVKTEKGKLSKEQLEWKEKLTMHGCHYYVCTCLEHAVHNLLWDHEPIDGEQKLLF